MSGDLSFERCLQPLQDAMKRHDIAAFLQMFTDDAVFEFDARRPWVAHAQIRDILDDDGAVHGRLRFINGRTEGLQSPASFWSRMTASP